MAARDHSVVPSLLTPGQTFDIPTQPPSHPNMTASADAHSQWEAAFARGLFDTLSPVGPRGTPHPTKWPQRHASDAEKLVVICRCLQRVGFTLGQFLAALFADAPHSDRPEIYQMLSFFLHGRSPVAGERPLAIVKLIYHHKITRRGPGGTIPPPQFRIPQYALPPSARLLPAVHEPYLSQHNAIRDWAVRLTRRRVDEEARTLIAPKSLFRRPKSAASVTWDLLRSWDMTNVQETIASDAPVLFSIMTTVATDAKARERCKQAAQGPPHTDETGAGVNTAEAPHLSDEEGPASDSAPSSSDSEGSEDPALLRSVDSTASSRRPTREPAPGVPSGMMRDSWQAVTVFILALLRFRHQYAIVFATIIGVYCFSCNANRELIELLCHLGISTAYSTVLETMDMLGRDKLAYLRKLASACEHAPPTFLLVYDNINKMKRAWQPTAAHRDEMLCGTAATLIELEDVTADAFELEPLMKNIKDDVRSKLNAMMLIDDLDHAHLQGVGTGHILRQWVQLVPLLSRFSPDVEKLFSETHAKRRLRLRRSKIHPLQTSGINEATTLGTAQVLRNLLLEQLAMVGAWFNWVMIVGGDLLTSDRLHKLKKYLGKADTPFDRHDWLAPMAQLWHLKWNWQKCIFRLHWVEETGKNIFGLHADCNKLKRSSFNAKTCDFYPAHAILQDRFSAMSLEILRLICEEKTSTKAPDLPLTEAVQSYFSSGGSKSNISFSELQDWAAIANRRYMTAAAYEDALGDLPRDLDVYHDPEPVYEPDSDAMDTSEDGQGPAPAAKKKSARTREMKHQEKLANADKCLANNIAFMRVTLWYLELCAATAEGDIGRVFEIIKFLRFSFWGAGSTNYGNELFELACNFMADFPPKLRDAILDNYLVNPSGRPGHWLELDLLQEHFNFWLKRLFNSKTTSFEAHHLSRKVALNIQGLGDLRSLIARVFNFKRASFAHTNPDKVSDINTLGSHYRTDRTLVFVKGRDQPRLVQDEFAAGIDIVLHKGKFSEFIQHTSLKEGRLHAVEEGMEDLHVNDESAESIIHPANPVVYSSASGMTTTQFVE
ncbi:hypothetical protein GGF50DRAFT_66457 [Schizophyllum commune]